MIPPLLVVDFAFVCIPRESGDDPIVQSIIPVALLYSPRERG